MLVWTTDKQYNTTILSRVTLIAITLKKSNQIQNLAKCGCFLCAKSIHVTCYHDCSSSHLVKVPHLGDACKFKVCAYPHPRDRRSDQSPHPIPSTPPPSGITLMMASAQVVETSVNTNNSPSQDYTTNPDDHSNHNITLIGALRTSHLVL